MMNSILVMPNISVKDTHELKKENDREMLDRHIDRKTTLKWLKRMVERGLVKKTKMTYIVLHRKDIMKRYLDTTMGIFVTKINAIAFQRIAGRKTRGIRKASGNIRNIHLYEKFKSRRSRF